MGKIHSDTNRSSLHENMRKKKKSIRYPNQAISSGVGLIER